ncbi:MAG: 50S ribosomal protein L4 [Deltaproteobacteria bacterium]|nr:50S ribosomal protein L4 [Deltaproteobacteria bacterium]
MARLKVHNLQGQETGEIELADEVFGLTEINKNLFYEVVKAQLASRRAGTHAGKNRSATTGSKKKVYKQKGTGNARHGDRRAPIFAKGGKVHMPTPRDYGYRPPAKVRSGALRHALSLFVKEGRIKVLDAFALDAIKTRAVAQALGTLEAKGKTVVVDTKENDKLRLSTRNLETAMFLPPEGVNVYDLLRHDTLILTQDAARALEQRLTK